MMVLKHSTDKKALFNALSQDRKPYKNALSVYAMESSEYKLYIAVKKMMHALWLEYIDTLGWDELADINHDKWVDDKRIELGIK